MKTDIEDLFIIDSFFVGDNRGFFNKLFERDIYESAGITFSVNETFMSKSSKNVIRGLHFQTNNPQAKLVTVISGKAWDVAVDLRKDSETYRKWMAVELSEHNHRAFYIPRGFAHGFLSMSDDTIMLYQCDGKYDKETDTGIRFDCPEIAVEWPINVENATVSERDMGLMSFAEYENNSMII